MKDKEKTMSNHARIKKVITKSGKIMYYLGDGLWFGRISAAKAEILLATKTCVLWETVVK